MWIRNTKIFGALALWMSAAACSAAEDGAMAGNSAEEYVAGLPDNCIYEDGYTCAPETTGETGFTAAIDGSGMLSTVYLRAWNVSWEDFQQLDDFSDEQKKLKHYRVGFAQDDNNLIVVLRPLLLPWMEGGKPAGLSRGTIGPGVKYWIDKQSYTINKRLYQK